MSQPIIVNKHITLTNSSTPMYLTSKIYFAKTSTGLVINTDGYKGEKQSDYLKRLYNLTDEIFNKMVCGFMTFGIIQFYSGVDLHCAEMSMVTPRELATICDTHNAFFRCNKFKVYNGLCENKPIQILN